MSCLQGYIHTEVQSIFDVVGEPKFPNGDGEKVDIEWEIEINGKTLTIYNYKDGKNYNGEDGLEVEEITEWHIGGDGNIKAEIEELAKRLGNKEFQHLR